MRLRLTFQPLPGAPANALVAVVAAASSDTLDETALVPVVVEDRVAKEAVVAFRVGSAALGGGGGAGSCLASVICPGAGNGLALAVDVGSEIAANASMALTTRDPSARGVKSANLVMANPR